MRFAPFERIDFVHSTTNEKVGSYHIDRHDHGDILIPRTGDHVTLHKGKGKVLFATYDYVEGVIKIFVTDL